MFSELDYLQIKKDSFAIRNSYFSFIDFIWDWCELWQAFGKLFLLCARLTTPSGSTSSRCLGRPQCMPVSTYCPGLVVLSRTRKSPSRTRSLSASRLLMRLWYHVSLRSCSSFGATGARRRGGLGHWSSRTWAPAAAADVLDPTAPPHASWSFRASSKGPTQTVMFHKHKCGHLTVFVEEKEWVYLHCICQNVS